MGGAGACLFPGAWRADRWAATGLPVVLRPALAMHASHGGQATNDPSAAPQRAAWLRGALLPPAAVAPAPRRATRALWRRRRPLTHQRAERLAPGPPTPFCSRFLKNDGMTAYKR
jgi:hypothetical protein